LLDPRQEALKPGLQFAVSGLQLVAHSLVND
jgi:hypothetical protein